MTSFVIDHPRVFAQETMAEVSARLQAALEAAQPKVQHSREEPRKVAEADVLDAWGKDRRYADLGADYWAKKKPDEFRMAVGLRSAELSGDVDTANNLQRLSEPNARSQWIAVRGSVVAPDGTVVSTHTALKWGCPQAVLDEALSFSPSKANEAERAKLALRIGQR